MSDHIFSETVVCDYKIRKTWQKDKTEQKIKKVLVSTNVYTNNHTYFTSEQNNDGIYMLLRG